DVIALFGVGLQLARQLEARVFAPRQIADRARLQRPARARRRRVIRRLGQCLELIVGICAPPPGSGGGRRTAVESRHAGLDVDASLTAYSPSSASLAGKVAARLTI